MRILGAGQVTCRRLGLLILLLCLLLALLARR
jgi:hypothetical protein